MTSIRAFGKITMAQVANRRKLAKQWYLQEVSFCLKRRWFCSGMKFVRFLVAVVTKTTTMTAVKTRMIALKSN